MTLDAAILWLALNIYHEARNQSELAQLAVAHVTLNRAEDRGLTIRQVVLQPSQFSWTLKLDDWIPHDAVAYEKACRLAAVATKGYDFTQGALYFHKFTVQPYWAEHYAYVADFGVHKFYK